MALYGITGVHIDAKGRIERTRMCQIDGRTNSWIGQPSEYAACEVPNLIATGDDHRAMWSVTEKSKTR